MTRDEIGGILQNIPPELIKLLGDNWPENLDLAKYDDKQLQDFCGSVLVEYQKLLLTGEGGNVNVISEEGHGEMRMDTEQRILGYVYLIRDQ